jgi:hypothetical protein
MPDHGRWTKSTPSAPSLPAATRAERPAGPDCKLILDLRRVPEMGKVDEGRAGKAPRGLAAEAWVGGCRAG